MYADLVVLGGDPLSDIDQAANVRQTMANGVLHGVDELLAPFEAARTATAAATTSTLLPPLPAHPDNARYWWHDPHYVEAGRHACCAEG
jgi:hypothetical protein